MKRFTYTETPVSHHFRSLVCSHFTAHKDLAFMRLLDYLLFSSQYDRSSGQLLIPADLLRSFRFKGETKNFSGTRFVADFSNSFFPVSMSGYSNQHSKVRTVKSCRIPTWLQEARAKEYLVPASQKTVSLATGLPTDPYKQARDIAAEAVLLRAHAHSNQAGEVIDFLNGLPESVFNPVRDRVQQAMEVAFSLTSPKREHQLSLLNSISLSQKPFYAPTMRTSRIYGLGPSFLHTKRCVRDVLTRDYAKLDLKQFQLQIITHLWNLPGLRVRLSSLEQGIWRDFCREMKVSFDPDYKDALKTATYSLQYGAGKRNVEAELRDTFSAAQVAAYMGHSVVKSLLSARQARIDDLSLEGRATDASGRELRLDNWDETKDEYSKCTSILACQAQSYEMPLLFPAIQYARETESRPNPLYIVGWLHDGIWLHCEDKGLLSRDLKVIEALIVSEAQCILGFKIGVESEMPLLSMIREIAA